jgi:hypothetical protein
MECYAYGYPPPRLSWYKEVDPNNPTALIPLTEKTFKYKFEATIPEPDVCTDCILARITVINVISGDYGTYRLRATSEQSKGYMSEGRVRLYRKYNILFFNSLIMKFYFFSLSFSQKLPNVNNRLQIQITKVAEVHLKLINNQKIKIHLFPMCILLNSFKLFFIEIYKSSLIKFIVRQIINYFKINKLKRNLFYDFNFIQINREI